MHSGGSYISNNMSTCIHAGAEVDGIVSVQS